MNNDFKKFWANLGPDEKRGLAEKAGTSVAYLSQLAHGHREPGRKMIRKLVAADAMVTVEMFL